MDRKNVYTGGHALGIAVGTLFIFLLFVGGASAAFKEVQLTTATSNDQSAVISPDGTKIAFVSDRSGADEIWVMNADGSEQTKLTNLGTAEKPAWSPYGNEIAFSKRNPYDIWKVSADGSVVTQLTNTAADEYEPLYSPDGTKITYQYGFGGWPHVWIMNSDGSSQTPLATDHAMDLYSTWSPDGAKISYLYGSNYNVPLSLALMNPDGSGKTTIVGTPNTYGWFQAWSPDSSKIAFALSSNPAQLFDSRGVYVIKTDGSGLTKIANGDIAGQMQSWQSQVWSPDGSNIVYFSNDSGNIDVWRMNPDGSGKEQLTTNYEEDKMPIFSPDGKRVIFQTNRNGNWDIYAIELLTLSNSGGGTWQYNKDLTILNPGAALTDYQVLVNLTGDNFPIEANTSGADIRFTDAGGAELAYWIENWDFANRSGKVWVNVSGIPVGLSTMFMWYGNPSALSSSSGNTTFSILENYEDGDYTNVYNWIGDTAYFTVQNSIVKNGIYSISGGPFNTQTDEKSLIVNVSDQGENLILESYFRMGSGLQWDWGIQYLNSSDGIIIGVYKIEAGTGGGHWDWWDITGNHWIGVGPNNPYPFTYDSWQRLKIVLNRQTGKVNYTLYTADDKTVAWSVSDLTISTSNITIHSVISNCA
ncbi:MAG: DUF2341 domain-containing protein [Candidatus Methanoperedens sp.]